MSPTDWTGDQDYIVMISILVEQIHAIKSRCLGNLQLLKIAKISKVNDLDLI